MSFSIAETGQRLRDSLATVEWAVSQVPQEWPHNLPDYYPGGAWGVAMNLAHLTIRGAHRLPRP